MKITKQNYIWYTALLVWAVFSIAILVYIAFVEGNGLYPLYYNVGVKLNDAGNIYAGKCVTYSYWPGFALVFAVLAKFPYGIGRVLWSVISLGSIGYALYLLGRSIFPKSKNSIGAVILLALPLMFEGIANQQSNAFVAALSIIGGVCIYKERYLVGAFLLIFAGVSKVAPMAFVMLFLVMYPRKLWWRYIIAMVVILSVPVLIYGFDYMVAQHHNWIDFLSSETSERWEYRDFWVLYELVTKGIVSGNTLEGYPPMWYQGLQLCGAGTVCVVCLWVRYIKKFSSRSILAIVLMSGSVWWLLLGPSTEIATCVAGVGVACLGTILAKRSRAGFWLMVVAYICVALGSSGDYEYNARLLTTSDWIYGMLPFGALLMYIWVILCSQRALKVEFEESYIAKV